MNVKIKNKIAWYKGYEKLIMMGLLIIAIIIPFFVSGYLRILIQRDLVFIPAIFGVYILYSLLREVHFAQSIFIGLGSYITAFLAGKYFITNELLILLPLGLAISILFAIVIGTFIMKRTGFYFAVMGIAVTMVFWSIIYKTREITGGSDGISNIRNPSIFMVQLNDQALYYIVLMISIGMILLMRRIFNSPFSLQLRAIKGDLDKAASIGIPVKKLQRVAFVIAGAYAGVAGILLAFTYNYVSPEVFNWEYGAEFIEAAILGGVNYFIGPIVGASVFIILEFLVSTWFPYLWEIIIGLIVAIIVVTLGDEGITGAVRKLSIKLYPKKSIERTYKDGK